MSSHSAAISMEPLGAGATLSDRLRLAASKGQITEAQELYRAGAEFDADRVHFIASLLYKFGIRTLIYSLDKIL